MAASSKSNFILNKDGSVYHLSILPKHVSETIIAVGDPSRVFQVTEYFDKIEFEMNRREFVTQTGTYKGKRLTVISTGIGTDNVEIVLNELDMLVNYNLKKQTERTRKKRLRIIRIGTSGAIQEDIPLGSFLVSEYGVGLDNVPKFYPVKHTNYEEQIRQSIIEQVDLPEYPYVVKGSEDLISYFQEGFVVGNTVTSPGFYAPQGRSMRIRSRFPKLLDQLNYFHDDGFWLSNFEMETAGYYALGRVLGHEVISINAILANRIKDSFSGNPTRTINTLIRKVLDRIYESDL